MDFMQVQKNLAAQMQTQNQGTKVPSQTDIDHFVQAFSTAQEKVESSLHDHKLFVTKMDDSPITMQDIEAEMEYTKDIIAKQISLFWGQDIPDGFSFTCTPEGRVVVEGDCPNKAAIEAWINRHDELVNMCYKLSGLASLKHAAEEAEEFQKLYAQNPQLAVEKYRYLFDERRSCQVHFTYQDGQITTRVEVQYGEA